MTALCRIARMLLGLVQGSHPGGFGKEVVGKGLKVCVDSLFWSESPLHICSATEDSRIQLVRRLANKTVLQTGTQQ